MSDKAGKRPGFARRVALVAAAGALTLGSVAGLAGSASGDTEWRRSPVGTWAVEITFASGTKTERGLFALRPDGSFSLAVGKRTGFGSWQPTADGFRYAFRHYAFKADDTFDFELRGAQEGQVDADGTFTTTGTGTSLDADGNVQGVFETQVEGERYSLQSP
ncbi:hypothetical protein [Nonomuraea sp. B1E8]|uniref:hypothetical protein n=1 Tax=unclassified Nonomuraea TaxID=2593643 RepID=UPI00325E3133